MSRTSALLLSLMAFVGCQTTPSDPMGSGGSEGGMASGGSATGGSGGRTGGYNNPDGTLHTLECKQGKTEYQWTIVSQTCSIRPDRVLISLRGDPETMYPLMTVSFGDLEVGTRVTAYGGSMVPAEVDRGPDSVNLGEDACSGPSSVYTETSCEIELTALGRGEIEAGGAGGATIETGSHVRMRIACPAGLYSPGGDDYGGTLSEIIPAQFEIEARDCLLVGD